MRPADTWVDYELIDATNHNRLERWGKTLLIRPDPQIIWKNEEVSPLWARADAIYYRSAKGGGQWDYHKKLPQKWNIKWQDLTLIVSPTGFKHTGVFPEQAVNWAWYQEKIKAADRPVKVLNLFGYTGGATLACLAAGASVTHVDASKGMVAWARENAQASSLADRPCRWIVDDCAKFVQREIRRGSRYDAVIMDPPSYGRGPNGEIWKLEDNVYDLITLTEQVLSDKPLFFVINSYTEGLSPAVMEYVLKTTLCPKATVWPVQNKYRGCHPPCSASCLPVLRKCSAEHQSSCCALPSRRNPSTGRWVRPTQCCGHRGAVSWPYRKGRSGPPHCRLRHTHGIGSRCRALPRQRLPPSSRNSCGASAILPSCHRSGRW